MQAMQVLLLLARFNTVVCCIRFETLVFQPAQIPRASTETRVTPVLSYGDHVVVCVSFRAERVGLSKTVKWFLRSGHSLGLEYHHLT